MPSHRTISEQVIEVPKILIDELPARTLVREPQLAEQLVEVPTIISFSSLQRIVEQNVDVPVPRGGVRGLQGFPPPGQSSTTSSFSLERSSERNVEQIAGFPGGGLQDFLPGQSSSSSSHVPARAYDALDAPGEGGFSHFSPPKKVRSRVRTLGQNCSPSRTHPPRLLSSVWVMILDEHGLYFWNMDTGETRRQMEEGFNPRWWLRDGQYFDLGNLVF